MQLESVNVQDILEFRSDMEDSLSWRVNEFMSLKNLLRDDNNVPVVKTLIVMLYAHFEGFFKDCLECHIKFINSTNLTLDNFADTIITASLSREYASFEDSNRKCKELTSVPPAEEYLHRYHRRRELTKKFTSNYLDKKIRIDEKIINTKSNLDYCVLQENLYILGFDYNYFVDKQDTINKLVKLRNAVAHGSQKDPINFTTFVKMEEDILGIMEEIILYFFDFCYEKKYLKISANEDEE